MYVCDSVGVMGFRRSVPNCILCALCVIMPYVYIYSSVSSLVYPLFKTCLIRPSGGFGFVGPDGQPANPVLTMAVRVPTLHNVHRKLPPPASTSTCSRSEGTCTGLVLVLDGGEGKLYLQRVDLQQIMSRQWGAPYKTVKRTITSSQYCRRCGYF